MKEYLLQKQWYRNLFNSKTFVKSDGVWINIKNYTGGKITDVDGKWRSQTFCKCGNELVHSNSFIQEREMGKWSVFDYRCSNCGEVQYRNPDIMPMLVPCQFDGSLPSEPIRPVPTSPTPQ